MPVPNLFDFLLKLCSLGFVFLIYTTVLVALIIKKDPEAFFHVLLAGGIWYAYSEIIKDQLYDILKDVYYYIVMGKRQFMAFLNSK